MSNIDPTQPTYATATTQSVRDNFGIAKSEIEALQAAMDTLPFAGDGTIDGPVIFAGPPVTLSGSIIQASLDALPVNGGSIMLAANTTYVVTTAIASSKNNVRITAPSWNTIIQRGPTFSGALLQLNGDGCLIEGVTFDGNGAVVGAISSGATEAAITGANSRITNCQFINSSATMNISCAGAGCRVDHCTITGMGISLSTERGFGIWAVNNVQVFLEHNHITGTGIEAIGFNGPGSVANGNIISGCHCWSGGPGGQLWSYPYTASESGTVVSNNFIGKGQDTSSGGMELSGNNVTCVGNTIVNQYMGGIQLDSGRGVTITGNTILNVGLNMGGAQDGIYVLPGITDFVISGNRIADDNATPNMRYGIVVNTGASDRYTITGNLIFPFGTLGIADGGTGTNKVISNNTGSPLGLCLPLVGGTVNGLVKIVPDNSGIPGLIMDGTLSGQARQIKIATGGSARWVIGAAGGTLSDQTFYLNAYDDTGVYASTPFAIDRTSGHVTMTPGLTVANGLTSDSGTFSGAVALNGGATFNGTGAHFGSVAATGADLTKHIDLYGNGYGINIANSGVGVVANYALIGNFITGWNGKVGSDTPNTGVFTTVTVGSGAGPTWTTGSGAPSSTQPVGSLYSRVSTWAAGATLYVSKGGGAWTAVAGV
jgi:hypothetical protein